jgi:hypothetical protein
MNNKNSNKHKSITLNDFFPIVQKKQKLTSNELEQTIENENENKENKEETKTNIIKKKRNKETSKAHQQMLLNSGYDGSLNENGERTKPILNEHRLVGYLDLLEHRQDNNTKLKGEFRVVHRSRVHGQSQQKTQNKFKYHSVVTRLQAFERAWNCYVENNMHKEKGLHVANIKTSTDHWNEATIKHPTIKNSFRLHPSNSSSVDTKLGRINGIECTKCGLLNDFQYDKFNNNRCICRSNTCIQTEGKSTTEKLLLNVIRSLETNGCRGTRRGTRTEEVRRVY